MYTAPAPKEAIPNPAIRTIGATATALKAIKCVSTITFVACEAVAPSRSPKVLHSAICSQQVVWTDDHDKWKDRWSNQ